ncbi:hypothetical protein EB796_005934 [Bugula neritina]|uniref:Uncharacterized protein n=1 Tax=Bugula neritina TaxID=10212 RepID=A0A7J7KAU6_BUGNE|nr:hypothetical protein EB796_005934 [Bugula neritina]
MLLCLISLAEYSPLANNKAGRASRQLQLHSTMSEYTLLLELHETRLPAARQAAAAVLLNATVQHGHFM